MGDITGAGAGAGKGKGAGTKTLKPSRATGAGKDQETERAEHADDMQLRSAWVGELLATEHAIGRALMLLAGGREYADGTGCRLGGNGMAPRAARYVVARRGRTPSDTSLDDAASCAVLELVKQVAVWEYVLSLDTLPVSRLRDDACLRTHLAGCAWRAAFRSLDGDGGDGATGRQAGEHWDAVSLSLDAGQLASQRESLAAWARGERVLEETTETTARRALCSWLWRSLVPARAAGANAARERAGAIQRARFLIRLVHGAAWGDAARLAGYADGAAASKVLAARHTWATLAAAQVSDSAAHPTATALRRAWWTAARREVRARREARPWTRTTAARGARRPAGQRNVGPTLPGGGQLVREVRGSVAPRVSRRVRSLSVDIGAVARRQIDAREHAARVTAGARARLLALRERAAADWQTASQGLRRGFLRG